MARVYCIFSPLYNLYTTLFVLLKLKIFRQKDINLFFYGTLPIILYNKVRQICSGIFLMVLFALNVYALSFVRKFYEIFSITVKYYLPYNHFHEKNLYLLQYLQNQKEVPVTLYFLINTAAYTTVSTIC